MDSIPAGFPCSGRSIRRWFRSQHGPYRAGRRLKGFLQDFDPSLGESDHLTLIREINGAPSFSR